ncbi:MAG: lipid asymmetry maintenance protein MlaB [Thiotrichales bacterium]
MNDVQSSVPALVPAGAGEFLLSGALGLEQIQTLLAFPYAEGIVAYTIDLSRVSSADSSALALMLYWQRETRKRGCLVRYIHLPERLQSLIGLYDLHGILEIAG